MGLNEDGPCTAEERASLALKAHALERRSGPGARLETGALARDLNADRDATLSALILLGVEKLIDCRPGGGFFTKIPTMRECRSLYFYNGALLGTRLRQAEIVQRARDESIDLRTNAESDDGEAVARFAETLLIAIGRLSGDTHILQAIVETTSRLHAFPRSETAVFAGCFESLSGMRELLEAGLLLELIAAIATYHRRRVARVREIIRAGAVRADTAGSSLIRPMPFDRYGITPRFLTADGKKFGERRRTGNR